MGNSDQIKMNLENKTEKKFLFFDTETTDLLRREIIQLAFLTSDNKEFNMYFKPKCSISYAAMAIHHITPEMLEDKATFENSEYNGQKLKDFLEKLTKEYTWVAHNTEFDADVLKRVKIEIPNLICTLKIARDLLSVEQKDEVDLESYSLQFLRYYLGLYKKENTVNNTAHDALSDVYFLKNLFEYFQLNFNLTTEKMIYITKAPLIIRNLHQGKYSGKSIREIQKENPEYLQWVIDTWNDKPDIVWNIKRILDNN